MTISTSITTRCALAAAMLCAVAVSTIDAQTAGSSRDVDPSGVVGPSAGGVAVRIDTADAAAVDALGLRPMVDRDYGAFRWMVLDVGDEGRVRAAGIPFEADDDAFMLRLGDRRFDPIREGASAMSEPAATESDGFGLRLIQFDGPAKAEWLDALRAGGAQVVSYVHPFAYVIWSRASDGPAATDGGAIRWSGAFETEYRLLPRARRLADLPVEVHIVTYRGADVDAVAERLRQWQATTIRRRVVDERFEIIGCIISGSRLVDVASLPGVYSVQPVPQDGGARGEMSCQVNVNNIDGNNLAVPGYDTWLSIAGLMGTGVVMANVDLGVQQSHTDLVGRVLTCVGATCGGAAADDHGTHTAGLMVGTGATGTLDAWGFVRGQGVAPGAKIVEQLYEPFFTSPGGMLLLMSESSRNGAILSSNSWGSAATAQGYDNTAMQVDIGVRDADPDAPGNQALGYVLAIENGFGGASTQGAPDEAKNTITVGTSQFRSVNGAPNSFINWLAGVTAHGPALDGRRIPHLVAPGCYEDSTITGSSHGLLCGTSMAAPQVAGAAALFVQKFRGLYPWHGDPSPALIKAAILPVCHDLVGFNDANLQIMGHRPDSKQGWGRLDTEALVRPATVVDYFDQHVVFENTGEEWVRSVSVVDPQEPMRVMLVWTDAPGHGLGGTTPAWNNDLDLTVDVGADTYRGNVIGPNGWSTTGGTADGMNNAEAVLVGPGGPASATVHVIAADINSDGVPGVGDDTDQDFAAVCYNCTFPPSFAVSATPFTQSICVGTDAVYQIDVGLNEALAEQVTLSVIGAPAGVTLNIAPEVVSAPGVATLTIGNTAAVPAGTYAPQVRGQAELDTVASSITLRVFSAVPQTPALISPGVNAVNVSPLPTLSWASAGDVAVHEVQVATDIAFNNIAHAAAVAGSPYLLTTALETDTLYYWRARGVNSCGSGSYTSARSFRTLASPKVLLVDDDDDSPDVRTMYTSALDAVDYEYAIWNTGGGDNEPGVQVLARYSAVIWFTGDAFGGSAGPGTAGEAALAWFLDDGHCAFISSQDYLRDRGVTAFAADHLGVADFDEDVGQSTVTGGGLLTGLGPYALVYPFANVGDSLVPTSEAGVSLLGDVPVAGVEMDTGIYWSSFWSVPFEAIPDVNDRVDVLRAMLDHCGVLLDCNGNALHDPQEVLAMISPDCDGNLVPDACDLAAGRAADCQPNGTLDSCDIVTGPSTDANGDDIPDECEASCDFTPDCVLVGVCTAIRCISSLCTPFNHPYGDVNLDGGVDIFDILCVLDGFAGVFTQCPATETDFAQCMRDGTIDVFDILAVLDAFGGVDTCCGE
ncbi:MAG: S8 family serine peptidase [Phycisphaerales bacterium]|nr:S8 family serine peptidase [Phycisphaerales bacterium]